MLNIEVIKFEAQDVITASVCNHMDDTWTVTTGNMAKGYLDIKCNGCGETGTYDLANGNLDKNTANKIKW